jgi:hypothetical protein
LRSISFAIVSTCTGGGVKHGTPARTTSKRLTSTTFIAGRLCAREALPGALIFFHLEPQQIRIPR